MAKLHFITLHPKLKLVLAEECRFLEFLYTENSVLALPQEVTESFPKSIWKEYILFLLVSLYKVKYRCDLSRCVQAQKHYWSDGFGGGKNHRDAYIKLEIITDNYSTAPCKTSPIQNDKFVHSLSSVSW